MEKPCCELCHPTARALGHLGRAVLDTANVMWVGGFGPRQQDRVLLAITLAILLQESIPFAVIGSNTVVEAKGRRVRGRLYPWGIVEGNAMGGPVPAGTGTSRTPSPSCGPHAGDLGRGAGGAP